ncbi:MAG: ATP phosphoribosyltransferase regulatory subunit [Betaproteobacteria bacterium]|nr:ATP phosphoribosyltransferase regulatory subunit [Betaproteobacteria bacterium]
MRKWALPEAIDDVLPFEAARVETLRRTLLDCFREHGYRLVQPPLVEYLDSLLTGSGRDLDLQTFKTVDPVSGRLLGLRADTTPQVARIDAHLLNEPGVSRLCYAGSVLRTMPAGPGATREVLQIGAELYGHGEIAADREVLRLLLRALSSAKIDGLHVDLGHVGIYRALARSAGLAGDGEGDDSVLFAALRDKDGPSVRELTAAFPEPARTALRKLTELYGPAAATLGAARAVLPALPEISDALRTITSLADAVADGAVLQVDLADLRGYHYYTGATFDVFAADPRGSAVECGRGGRYDGVGRAFGRARPATGFTLDLRRVAALASDFVARDTIVAPDDDDPALAAKIDELRATGEAVVVRLPGEPVDPRTARRLARDGAAWRVLAG